LAYVIRDGFPVTQYHSHIIPKRHTKDYFGLTQAEINAINSLMHEQKALLDQQDKTIEGYNIGMNCGEIAGQSVWHCHVHLIPRLKGDAKGFYPLFTSRVSGLELTFICKDCSQERLEKSRKSVFSLCNVKS
jgi:diadenosine tetraphosphate (Ap4A) HIT family hydrolase